MSVRAKLCLDQIIKDQFGAQLVFTARYDDTIPEDQRFQTATPTARAEFRIDNPKAVEQFTQGEFYYVDFSPVPKA